MNISEYFNNIKKSVNNYNEAFENKYDSFGKKSFPHKFKMKGNIYVGGAIIGYEYTKKYSRL